ncbi:MULTISPECIES: TetR/AcrR family transcriptional regulator [Micrococcaceae]|nr:MULTISPECIES: TetR/AcrR family transcriptional regulator [Micrococcaceae]PCC26163.1 TetR/AcrR family transcriptional regulator [Glutamicibacter sp. BW78]
MTRTLTPREQARERTMAEILRIAREQLAAEGPAALSLRAVARQLGIVSSAIYRYVSSRDELLTLLIVEAYSDLGEQVETAVADAPAHPLERFEVLARAVRSWALGDAARYALLFGTPVPGYTAPAALTNEAGTRVVVALFTILDEAWNNGTITTAASGSDGQQETHIPVRLGQDLEAIRQEYGIAMPAELVARGFSCWSGLFGAVTFEVFGHYGPATFGDPGEIFEQTVRLLATQVGLNPGSSAVGGI